MRILKIGLAAVLVLSCATPVFAQDRSPAGERSDRGDRGGGNNRGGGGEGSISSGGYVREGERRAGSHDSRGTAASEADRDHGGNIDRGRNNPGPGMADHDADRHAEGHPENNPD